MESSGLLAFGANITSDIAWAILIGYVINEVTTTISDQLNLPKLVKIILQVTLNILVLYGLLKYEKWLAQFILAPHLRESIDLLFIPFLFSAQKNIDNWIDDIAYHKSIPGLTGPANVPASTTMR
jgi:hypothetical protein